MKFFKKGFTPLNTAKGNLTGFTLIEITIVILVIAILMISTMVGLLSIRAKTRDVNRVSDIKQAQNALELYFYTRNRYPLAQNITLGNDNYQVLCDSDAGWQNNTEGCDKIFFEQVPSAPTPPANGAYIYSGADESYTIIFSLEKGIEGLTAGRHAASERGIN